MAKIDTKSLRIFEDMKSGLYERGYDENQLIITGEEPLRYEVEINSSEFAGIKDLHSTLWAQYSPDRQLVSVGVTFSDRIPDEKIPFTMAFLNTMNGASTLQHLTLCPACHKIDAVAGIFLISKRLPREKLQILLSNSESNIYFLHPTIRQIADDYSVDQLISMFCEDNPEFEKYYGGRP